MPDDELTNDPTAPADDASTTLDAPAGTVPEPELSDLEQSIVERFEARATSGEEERAGSESPEPSSESAEIPPSAGTTDAGGGETVSSPPPATSDADWFGTLDETQRNELHGLYEWAKTLTPEQAQRVYEVLATPVETPPGQVPTQPVAPTTPPAPAAQQLPQLPELDPDLLGPEVVSFLEAQNARMAQLEAQLAQTSTSTQAIERQRMTEALNAASAAVAERYDLTETDLQTLGARAAASNIAATLRDRYTDPVALFDAALDATFWTDPEFRSRAIQAEVARAAQEDAAIRATNAQKARNSAAVTSSSGSLPRVEPVPRDLSPDQRRAQMLEEIRAAQGGS